MAPIEQVVAFLLLVLSLLLVHRLPEPWRSYVADEDPPEESL